MKNEGTEIIVGAFVLAGLAVVIVGIFTIRGLGYHGLDEYHARYTNAAGIEVGTPVKFNGVLRGRVKSITIDPIDPMRVRVDFAVREGTPVTTTSIAKIAKADILGDAYVDLRFADVRAGTAAGMLPQGEPLPPGSEVVAGDAFDLQATLDHAQQAIESLSDLAELMKGELEGVVKAVQRLLDSGEQLLSDENRARIEASLRSVESATLQVDSILAGNRERIDAILENADQTVEGLDAVTRRLDAAIDDVVPRTTALLDETRESLSDVRKVLGSADRTLGAIDAQQVADLLGNIETASRNLVDLSRELRDRPSGLLRPDRPPPPRFSGRISPEPANPKTTSPEAP